MLRFTKHHPNCPSFWGKVGGEKRDTNQKTHTCKCHAYKSGINVPVLVWLLFLSYMQYEPELHTRDYRIYPSIVPCSIIIPPPNLKKVQKFDKNPIIIPWQIFDNLGANSASITQDSPIFIMTLSQNHQSFHVEHMIRPICHAKYHRFSLQKSSDTLWVWMHQILIIWNYNNVSSVAVKSSLVLIRSYPCTFPCMFRQISNHNPTP